MHTQYSVCSTIQTHCIQDLPTEEHISMYQWWNLTHWGLVTPYGVGDLGQHWIRQWLVAWRHQVITWTNVDWSSVKSSDIHIRVISQEMPQPSITKIHLKITYLKFPSHFPGANELKCENETWVTDRKICDWIINAVCNLAIFNCSNTALVRLFCENAGKQDIAILF